MPLDGYGGFTPPNPENPVRAGTLIKSDDFNSTIDDISDALSTAIYKDGQAAMEADLNMGHNNLVQTKSVQNDSDLAIRAQGKVDIQGKDVVNIKPSLSINDSQKAVSITSSAGTADALISTTPEGVLDQSFLPFEPPVDSAITIIAAEDLTAGDLVFIDTDGRIKPCTLAYKDELAIGFVLNDYLAGDTALMHTVGYNNKISIEDAPVGSPFVYISDTGANIVCFTPQTRKQVVGKVVGAGIIRFLPQIPASLLSPLFLYFGNI